MKMFFLTYLLIQDRGAGPTTGWGGNIGFFDAFLIFIVIAAFLTILTWFGAGVEKNTEKKKERKQIAKVNNWEKEIEQKWKSKRKSEMFKKLIKQKKEFELENGFKPPASFLDYADIDTIDYEWNLKKLKIIEAEKKKIRTKYEEDNKIRH